MKLLIIRQTKIEEKQKTENNIAMPKTETRIKTYSHSQRSLIEIKASHSTRMSINEWFFVHFSMFFTQKFLDGRSERLAVRAHTMQKRSVETQWVPNDKRPTALPLKVDVFVQRPKRYCVHTLQSRFVHRIGFCASTSLNEYMLCMCVYSYGWSAGGYETETRAGTKYNAMAFGIVEVTICMDSSRSHCRTSLTLLYRITKPHRCPPHRCILCIYIHIRYRFTCSLSLPFDRYRTSVEHISSIDQLLRVAAHDHLASQTVKMDGMDRMNGMDRMVSERVSRTQWYHGRVYSI